MSWHRADETSRRFGVIPASALIRLRAREAASCGRGRVRSPRRQSSRGPPERQKPATISRARGKIV